MAKDTKTIKVSTSSTKGFWTRPIIQPSMESIVEKWSKKGYKLVSTVPVAGAGGKTTHYLLTFEKEE